jgi:hypothetical protein
VNGKLQAIDGTGEEYGNHPWIDVVADWDAEHWSRLQVQVDVKRHEYTLAIDGKSFDHAPFHFRHDVNTIAQIGLLVEKEAGAYFDDLRVKPVKAAPHTP